MNYRKIKELEKELSIKLDKPINLTNLDNYFAYQRQFNDKSIKLHRNHIPLNPKICIQSQTAYRFYMETLFFVLEQLKQGVEPAYFVSYHYKHPSEMVRQVRETNNPLGHKDRIFFQSFCSHNYYKYWEKRRNSEVQLIKDVSHIRNILLNTLYGIKRLDRTDLKEFPNLFFFHEKGKVGLQYHTHLLIPKKNLLPEFDSVKELKTLFNYLKTPKKVETKKGIKTRQPIKCLSHFKDIDVREVNNKEGVVGYLNKETNPNHISFDFYNSIPLLPS